MKAIVLLAAGFALAGCASGVSVGQVSQSATSERIAETNFTLGETRTAVVGEQVIRVKDYIQTTVSTAAVQVDRSARYTHGLGGGQVSAGGQFPLIGERSVDGQQFRLVQLGDSVIQLRPDGTPHNKGLVQSGYGDWIEPIPDLTFTPPVTFAPVTRIDTRTAASGENYEIVFTGRDADSMRFQYREYTTDDMARPAFSQDLTYPVSSPTIRFRGVVIAVDNVGVDSISYRVMSREAPTLIAPTSSKPMPGGNPAPVG